MQRQLDHAAEGLGCLIIVFSAAATLTVIVLVGLLILERLS